MRLSTLIVLSAACCSPGTAHAEDAVTASSPIIERLSGDIEVTPLPQKDGAVFYRAGDFRVTTPLPEGYPRPTPPGVVEVKQYPEVRRATFAGQGAGPDGMKNSQKAFFPLFAHIKLRGIAMTAPVEIDYSGLTEEDAEPDSYEMSFLYRAKSDGKIESYGKITVADAKPVRVVAIGVAGDVTLDKVLTSVAKLNKLVADSGKWRVVGEPRVLGYNGPDVPQPKRWGEVQLPLEAVGMPVE